MVEEIDAKHSALFIMNSWGCEELIPGGASAFEAIARRCTKTWMLDEQQKIEVTARYFKFLMVVASAHVGVSPWAKKAILTLCSTLYSYSPQQQRLLIMRLRGAVEEEPDLPSYPVVRTALEHLSNLGVDPTFVTPHSGYTDYKRRLLAAAALGIDPEVPDVQKVCRRLASYGWGARPGEEVGEVVIDADVLDEILCALREAGGRR